MLISSTRGLVAQAVVVLFAMTACTAPPAPSVTASPTASSTPPASASPLPSQTTATAPKPSVQPTAMGQSTKPAVKLDRPAETSGIKVNLTSLRAITSKPQGPGEVKGPAIRVDLRLTNESKKDFDATSVLVTLYDSKNDPGGEMLGAPHRPLQGVVKPGASATGVWVFNVPPSRRNPVRIMVTLPTDDPVLLFRGNAPS